MVLSKVSSLKKWLRLWCPLSHCGRDRFFTGGTKLAYIRRTFTTRLRSDITTKCWNSRLREWCIEPFELCEPF